MERRYLEIKETLTQTDEIERLPEIIRFEVKDEAEAKEKARELEGLIKKDKKILYHLHYHDQNPELNKPCVVKELTLEVERAL